MKLLVEIYMSELSRIRYLLRAYLRVRLQKIERFAMHILDNAGGWVWWAAVACMVRGLGEVFLANKIDLQQAILLW